MESKATILSEVNRKVKSKAPTVDNSRAKAGNPNKPQQKKGKLFSLFIKLLKKNKIINKALKTRCSLCLCSEYQDLRFDPLNDINVKLSCQ